MEQQSVIRAACKQSFHAYILPAAVTPLHRKIPFLLGQKPAVIYAFLFYIFLSFSFWVYFVAITVFPSIHFFAPVCTIFHTLQTLYYSSACEHLIQYFHKCHQCITLCNGLKMSRGVVRGQERWLQLIPFAFCKEQQLQSE